MMKVAILPIPADHGILSYRAVAGTTTASGMTPGAALDALTAQFTADETSTLVVVQSLRPDRYFTATQQQRITELMERWRHARDQHTALSVEEQTELELLIDVELSATTQRAAALADELGR